MATITCEPVWCQSYRQLVRRESPSCSAPVSVRGHKSSHVPAQGHHQRSQVTLLAGKSSTSGVTGQSTHICTNTFRRPMLQARNWEKSAAEKKNSPNHNRHQKIIRQISTEAGIKPMRLLTPVYNCNRLCWLPSLPIHLWKSPIALSDSIWAKHLWPAALNHHYNLPPQSPPGTDGAGDNALRGSRFNKPSS